MRFVDFDELSKMPSGTVFQWFYLEDDELFDASTLHAIWKPEGETKLSTIVSLEPYIVDDARFVAGSAADIIFAQCNYDETDMIDADVYGVYDQEEVRAISTVIHMIMADRELQG